MKRLYNMVMFIDGVAVGQAAEFVPPETEIEPLNLKGSATIRWATPRNDEKWQGSGKRRKPKLK